MVLYHYQFNLQIKSPEKNNKILGSIWQNCIQFWASPVAQWWRIHLPVQEMRCRRPGFDPGLGRSPGGGHGNPLQYSCLENPQGQRNLAGYSPWGRKELDTTERLNWTELNHLQCGKLGFDNWVGKIPWRRAWQPTPVFLPGESPCAEEPGKLRSMGPQRVGRDLATKQP